MPTEPFLASRRREAEWMDEPDVDPTELRRALRFIRRINRILGYTRQTISHLAAFSRNWKPGERIHIIDFATGSGDVPREIVDWSTRRGFDVHVTGIDLHAATIRLAASQTNDHRITLLQADALNLPFEPRTFDYAICSMFLHHLGDEQAIAVLRAMDNVARRGIITADLLRERHAYNWISLFTLFASRMIRHDARASIRQSFNTEEVTALCDRAGLRYVRFHRHFAHRFVLAGEKV